MEYSEVASAPNYSRADMSHTCFRRELTFFAKPAKLEPEVYILMITEIAGVETAALNERIPGIQRGRTARGKAFAAQRCFVDGSAKSAAPSVSVGEIAVAGPIEN